MRSLLGRMSLPLLVKELLEQAARRRTYLIRIVYVALLTYFSLVTIERQLRTVNPLSVLGQGGPALIGLVNFQFLGIYLLLPGMACGVITTEKERNTLALLFLTRLGPWTIITEKLLGRLFPMLMFLMCGLPVMAFTYSLGGLTLFQLFIAAYYLILALVLVGCIAVMCSTLSNSTTAAFIQSYFVLMLLGAGPAIASSFAPRWLLDTISLSLGNLAQLSKTLPNGQIVVLYHHVLAPQTMMQLFSPAGLFTVFMNHGAGLPTEPWVPAILLGIPSCLASLICLVIARRSLYRRAFVGPSNPLLKLLRGIDKVFFWVNRKVPFDVKLVKESDSLPNYEPIAWREVSKRSLGQFRYLVRIVIPLMFPVIFMGIFMVTSSANEVGAGGGIGLMPMVLFLWAVSLILVMITAASAIPLEKTRQTWDVLRSLPMTGREILVQKLRGVRRLQWVCSIPVISAIGLQAWWQYQLHALRAPPLIAGVPSMIAEFYWWEYLLGEIASVVIYAELVKWVSLWCGLTFSTAMRAMLMAILSIAAVIIIPEVLLMLFIYGVIIPFLPEFFLPLMNVLRCMNPWVFVPLNETGQLRSLFTVPLIPALINIASQGGMLWLIHRHIVQRAEWYLERIGVSGAVRTSEVVSLHSPSDPVADSTGLPEIANAD